MVGTTKRTWKVTSSGWWYWLARHSEKGLVLLDAYDQTGLVEGQLRAFVLNSRSSEVFDRSSFKACLGGAVSGGDFVSLVNKYNSFKVATGRPIKAPPEVAHANFLEARGLPAQQLRRAAHAPIHRETHCYRSGLITPSLRLFSTTYWQADLAPEKRTP